MQEQPFPPFPLNKFVESRLAGIRLSLLAAFNAGQDLSSATKGREREAFVEAFLSQVFSPAYRFGSGNITSIDDRRSGQVDIVVESPFWYSLPVHPNGPRLYMAEGVAAAIEVKTNLDAQWHDVLTTTEKVKQLRRRYTKQHLEELVTVMQAARTWETVITELHGVDAKTVDVTTLSKIQALLTEGNTEKNEGPSRIIPNFDNELRALADEIAKQPQVRDKIPCYAVGFSGWKTPEAFADAFEKAAELDGAILLDPPRGYFRLPDKPILPINGEWVLSFFLDQIAVAIGEIAKMEMPQLGNYGMSLACRFFTKPKDVFEKLTGFANKPLDSK